MIKNLGVPQNNAEHPNRVVITCKGLVVDMGTTRGGTYRNTSRKGDITPWSGR